MIKVLLMSARAPSTLRLLGWGAAAVLVALPWLAMQVSAEVDWTGTDFLLFAALLAGVGGVLELAVRRSACPAWRLAMALAAGTGFMLVWVNGAAGVIGSEGDPINQLFIAVPIVTSVGAVLARLQPAGMALAMLAGALVQGGITVLAVAVTGQFSVLSVLFVGSWLAVAAIFRRVA